MLKRIYLNQALAQQHHHVLTGEAFHYLVRVLRCRDGEQLLAFNGNGFDYTATLQLVGKKSANILVESATQNTNESPLHTILLQGLSKGERMDIVMQKAVELGVNEIIPVKTEFCAVKLAGERLQKKMQHWQSVIISACEQCERAVVPVLSPVTELSTAMRGINAPVKWILHPRLADSTKTHHAADPVERAAVLIGPEGGFSITEVEAAIAHGFTTIALGKRILRTETAAITALSICQQRWGDFGRNDI